MKKLTTYTLMTVTFATAVIAYAASSENEEQKFREDIEALLEHTLPRAHIGIVVADAETGKVIYDHMGYKAFLPASNTKLFTAAASLYGLGPDYRYSTVVYANKKKIEQHDLKSDIYFKFTGDPSLKAEHIHRLVLKIKSSGIKKISGKIIFDTSTFKKPHYGLGWGQDDKHWYYSAPISSIIINQNAQGVNLSPNPELNKNALTSLADSPLKKYFTLDSNVKTVNYHDAQKHCQFNINVDNKNNISLDGCWPINKRSKYMKIAVQNPELIAQQLIKSELKKAGITFSGKFGNGKVPKNVDIIATHQSAPIRTLLHTLMKDSNNVYAEAFTKTLGREVYKKGTFQQGVNAMEYILHKRTDIDFSKMTLVDGSGQSRYNLVTPHQIVRLLQVVHNSPDIKKYFVASLPLSGKNGTLKNRLQSFDLNQYINAKTGTLRDTSTLSGYITTKSGKTLVFSILINNVIDDIRTAKLVQSKVLSIIWGQA